MAYSNEELMVIEKMNDKGNFDKLHPILKKKLFALICKLEEEGISIRFSESFRNLERQKQLYAQGRTAPGHIVTNCDGITSTSQHQWGIAIDFYLNMDVDGDGEVKDDAFNNVSGLFQKVGRRAVDIGFGWGGLWNNVDLPHLYLPYWGATGKRLMEEFGTYENFRNSWAEDSITGETSNKDEIQDWVQDLGWNETEWVKSVQRAIGAKTDGIVGTETISKTPTLGKNMNSRHAAVLQVQKKLNILGHNCGAEDGIFGKNTERGVVDFQNKFLRMPDGVMHGGNITWQKLLKKKL